MTNHDRTRDERIGSVVRDEVGRIVASLTRWCGDLDIAEEAVSDAVERAVVEWRRDGLPERPGAWLHIVARRRALDRIRRHRRFTERLPLLVDEPSEPLSNEPLDEPLGLLFACCHPALGREAQLTLTLRAVIGLTTDQIARAFLSNDSTITRRVSRAKQKIVTTSIPLVLPPADRLGERLDEVLAVIYLAFNEGYLATSGPVGHDHDLAEDALWLAAMVARRFPAEPEAIGLHALLTLLHARRGARWDDGRIVLLADQDRTRWDHDAIAQGIAMVEHAATLRRPGRYQLQAAIAAVHGEALTMETSDWPQIVVLYDLLRRYDDSPVVRLNRAVALSHVAGPEVALDDVDLLGDRLRGYHLFHAVRGHLLRALGRIDEARQAEATALELTRNQAEQAVLRSRLEEHDVVLPDRTG